MATLISVFGYAKSGKTLFLETLCTEAQSRGVSVAYLKAGRLAHRTTGAPVSPTTAPPNGSPVAPGPPEASSAESTAPDREATGVRGVPDTRRLLAAGAQPALLWSEEGLFEEGEAGLDLITAVPLPSRDAFPKRWESRLPRETHSLLLSRGLLLLEGRAAAGARVVHTSRIGAPVGEALKLEPGQGELVVRGVEEFEAAIMELLSGVPREGRSE